MEVNFVLKFSNGCEVSLTKEEAKELYDYLKSVFAPNPNIFIRDSSDGRRNQFIPSVWYSTKSL